MYKCFLFKLLPDDCAKKQPILRRINYEYCENYSEEMESSAKLRRGIEEEMKVRCISLGQELFFFS